MSGSTSFYQPRLSCISAFIECLAATPRQERAFNAVDKVKEAQTAERQKLNSLAIMKQNSAMGESSYKEFVKLIFSNEVGSRLLCLFQEIVEKAEKQGLVLCNEEVARMMLSDHYHEPDILTPATSGEIDNFYKFFKIKNTGKAADSFTTEQELLMKAAILENWIDLLADQIRAPQVNEDGSPNFADMLPKDRAMWEKRLAEEAEKKKEADEKAALQKTGPRKNKRKVELVDLSDAASTVEEDAKELDELKSNAKRSSSSSRDGTQGMFGLVTTVLQKIVNGPGQSSSSSDMPQMVQQAPQYGFVSPPPNPSAHAVRPVHPSLQEAWESLHSVDQQLEDQGAQIEILLRDLGCTKASLLEGLDEGDIKVLCACLKKSPAKLVMKLLTPFCEPSTIDYDMAQPSLLQFGSPQGHIFGNTSTNSSTNNSREYK